MAEIILGIGMSHSPMMATEGKFWPEFAKQDLHNPMLYDEKGNRVTYEELDEKRNSRYNEYAKLDNFLDLHQNMKNAFTRLKNDLADASPDVVLIVTNDHPLELFETSNVPALAVYCGDEIISASELHRAKRRGKKRMGDIPEAFEQMASGMGMEKNHRWPGDRETGVHLIEELTEQGFDVAALQEVEDPTKNGHGHGIGMAVKELMDEDQVFPMIPIYLNTWPPNVTPPSRCYDFGNALRKAIESLPKDLKVAVIASGGLSHFVTDYDLDQIVIQALHSRLEEDLRNLPRNRLKAGNSEIRNWVTLAGSVEHLDVDWCEYFPVFRTSSGTGIGMTFMKFS